MLALSAAKGSDSKAEFKAGFKAYREGDFDIALEKWTPLADEGAVEAQVNLGIMYAKGEGVEKTRTPPLAGTARRTRAATPRRLSTSASCTRTVNPSRRATTTP
jgi:TPR repeat protein